MYTNDEALTMFKDGFNCSQIVFSHFAPSLGLQEDLALKIASGFGAGMGRMAHICGAVTGAFMVLGLKYGYHAGGSPESKENIYGKVRDFTEQFKARHSSIVCRELLGIDITSPAGFARAREIDIFRTNCPRYVAEAINILQNMIDEDSTNS